MPRTVLYPGCPVCGQNIRSLEWLEGVGERPVSVAHIAKFARRSIERRELALGERAPPEAEEIIGYNDDGDIVWRAAGKREAPTGWLDRLDVAMKRAAAALGYRLVRADEGDDAEVISGEALRDPSLTKREFGKIAKAYLADAEAELELRRGEVEREIRRRGFDR